LLLIPPEELYEFSQLFTPSILRESVFSQKVITMMESDSSNSGAWSGLCGCQNTINRVNIADATRALVLGSSWVSCTLILIVAAASVGELVFNNYIGTFPSDMYMYILTNDRAAFRKALGYFIGEVIAMAVLITIKLYFAERAAIIYRRNIDDLIHKEYLSGNNFYDLLIHDTQIDNPDGRITQNVLDFASGFCVQVFPKLIQSPCNIVWYTYRVATFLDWRMVLLAYAFGITSVSVVRLLMHPVVRKNYVYQARHADFRLSHVELRTGAEEVALSHGQPNERKLLAHRLQSVLTNQRSLANWKLPMNIAIEIFAYTGGILTYIAVMIYLRSHSEITDPMKISSLVSMADFYIIMVIWGFTQLFELFLNTGLSISDLCAYATRIMEMLRVLVEHKQYVKDADRGNCIEMKAVTVASPDSTVLIPNLSFSVRSGESLFISGPSGVGKSSIFRVLGQLWPTGNGSVTVPVDFGENLAMMVLTQDPYVPLLPQLECVAFPRNITDIRTDIVNEIIHFLELGHLMKRDPEDWQSGLSPGERQRLALARVLLHQPRFLLMDEATSAIPTVLERKIYERIQSMQISMISISHNPDLRVFHTNSLDIDEKGRYKIYRNG
jgi:ABC-type uncharacterized transport system fused permease/ATPase subunit